MDNNLISRINSLLQEKGMSQKQFISQMFPYTNNSTQKYESQKSNFSKMLSGQRDFPPKYILPIERVLDVSWRYLVDGGERDKDFPLKGLRYAAFKGGYQDFELLGKELSHGESVIEATDEYGNSVLDYIFEYKAIEGLRYLYDNKLVSLDDLSAGRVFSLRGQKESCKDAFLLVCEKDDQSLFSKLFDSYRLLGMNESKETVFTDPDAESALLETHEIFDSLLTEKTYSLKELNPQVTSSTISQKEFTVCNPYLSSLLTYALRDANRYQQRIRKILEFGKAFNEKRIGRIEQMTPGEQSDIRLDEKGNLSCARLRIGNLFTYQLSQQPDISLEQTKALQVINDQINSVKFLEKPLLGGFSGNQSRIVDGQVAKRTTGNENEYHFLQLMADKGIKEIPQLLKKEKGLDYFTYFPGTSASYVIAMPIEKTIQVVKLLKTINSISKKTLKNGKVYCHGDLSPMNAVFQGDTLVGIIDWDSTYIGEEYEDFIYLAWTWLNIGDFLRDNTAILNGLLKMVEAYGADSGLKKNFVQKMISVMEAKLSHTPKGSQNYVRIFQWVGWSEVWVNLMKDEITKRIG
jgi:hypothetical protein